jgi:O-acetylserine/cysteine efflux transporter
MDLPRTLPLKAAAEAGLSGRELAAALSVVIIWGMNFVAMKFGLRDFTPFQLGAARYAFAALPLVFVVKPPRLRWTWVVLYGLLQGVGQFGFLFAALQSGMTAALASVLMQTQLFFTAGFGYLLLRERASRPLQIGLLLAALALACFSANYLAPRSSANVTTVWGFVLTLCAAAMWAASNVIARKAQQASAGFDAMSFVVWSALVPVLPFLLLSLAFDDPATRWKWTSTSWTDWLAVAYLGWIATIVAYTMWTGLLKRHSANRVAPFGLGVPVVGLAAGLLLLGETITLWQWAGIAFVIAALACVMFGRRWTGLRAIADIRTGPG